MNLAVKLWHKICIIQKKIVILQAIHVVRIMRVRVWSTICVRN